MENLDLPSLRELFLQRNCITKIEGLQSCPRLRKLWLTQNKISSITGLHAVPELEELWLQANQIDNLDGLENVVQLVILHIAGNPVKEYSELRKLSDAHHKLRDLSLQDIHFGRCPVVDDDGYKHFISCHLRQVTVLDGVQISSEQSSFAMESMWAEVR